ncbi:hypothetical protein [Mesorhizobium sp.]|uniref:hypothetical protein n=1 Tax=Mesorhizobium sp. TaxID=1871066 RepID=UPI000FE38E34|nr:hypothetical protein [Mesorhizobium sp.]RWC02456.1 MAG: hypothetical protein EOQ56_11480 [Mesorhizobium sp.]RWQ20970.1 MAG: hypothetical protein EOR92_10710 [Mesorhizobium sp.]
MNMLFEFELPPRFDLEKVGRSLLRRKSRATRKTFQLKDYRKMKMESSWSFDTPGPMPREAVLAFDSLLGKVVGQGSRWSMLEHFKGYFGGIDRSSSESWAESDLDRLMC